MTLIKMLVVDDYKETADTIALIYGEKGNVNIVGSARNSEQMWQVLAEKEVEFLSLDIQLGDENGLEICRMVHEKYPHVFITMCSVEATVKNRKIAMEAGASHFLAKPVGLDEASEALHKFSIRKNGAKETVEPLSDDSIDELFEMLL